MQNIKNIIFDFGGIFIDIDYQKTEDAFIQLGVTNFKDLYTQHHANALFEDLETGKIEPIAFYNAIRDVAKLNLTNEQIRDAWNAMLGNFLYEQIEWLQTAKQRYNIYLYSNTNQIHYESFMATFSAENNGQCFDTPFVKTYYSHICGYRKPYKESYQKILEENNLAANETLFIDDTLKNIEGAKAAGINTLHVVPPQRVTSQGL